MKACRFSFTLLVFLLPPTSSIHKLIEYVRVNAKAALHRKVDLDLKKIFSRIFF